MDFHAAMETFAEAWVAANTQTVVNTEGQVAKSTPVEDLPTQLPRDQLVVTKTTAPTPQPPVPPQLSPASASSTRSLPVHCIIEQTSGQPSFEASPNEKSSTHNTVELDTYAILPGTTLLSECTRAALVKLGYQSAEALGAKGAIQIKNWKPLGFETITDDKAATIDDILGELTQVSTLRIRLCSDFLDKSPTIWTEKMVRSAVISLLKEMNQPMLAKLSPLSQSAISNIANWKYNTSLSREKCKAFGAWFKQYKAEKNRANDLPFDTTRETRLTFHPEHEIPMMRNWYNQNKNPNDEKLYFYANELNKGCIRQERPMVTVAKLKNWWKNERQREKRLSHSSLQSDTVQSSHQADTVTCSFTDADSSEVCRRTRAEKRLKLEQHARRRSLGNQEEVSQSEMKKDTQPMEGATFGDNSGEYSSQQEGSQYEMKTDTQQSVVRATFGDKSEEYSSQPEGSQSEMKKDTQPMARTAFGDNSEEYSSQPGFVSLLHSTTSSETEGQVETDSQVVLSDGTVVQAVSFLGQAVSSTGSQEELPPFRQDVPGSQPSRTGDWNQVTDGQRIPQDRYQATNPWT